MCPNATGIGPANCAFGGGNSPLDLVALIGQSNITTVSALNLNSLFPTILQTPLAACIQSNYLNTGSGVDFAVNEDWHPVSSYQNAPTASGTPAGPLIAHFSVPLAYFMYLGGLVPAIAANGQGGLGTNYWAANTAIWCPFMIAQFQKLNPKRIRSFGIVIFDGESNCTSSNGALPGQWHADMDVCVAAYESAFLAAFPAYVGPSMRIGVMQITANYITAGTATVRAQQAAFAAAHANCFLADDPTTTFVDLTTHLDVPSLVNSGGPLGTGYASLF